MTITVQEDLTYSSALEFVEALRPSNPLWEGDDDIDTGWIFRGQKTSLWQLCPSAFRVNKPDELLIKYRDHLKSQYSTQELFDWFTPNTPQPPGLSVIEWKNRVSDAVLQALTHAAMVHEFVLLSDRAGHRMHNPDFLWHLFNRDAYKNSLGAFFEGRINNQDMVAFAVAQHHGVPTGLLDWTYNPLVAAFFASEKLALAGSVNSSDSIAVWALNRKLLNLDIHLRRLTVPAGMVPFLDAQEGLFTWYPQAYNLHLEEGRFVYFDELVHRTATDAYSRGHKPPFLRKLILPARAIAFSAERQIA